MTPVQTTRVIGRQNTAPYILTRMKAMKMPKNQVLATGNVTIAKDGASPTNFEYKFLKGPANKAARLFISGVKTAAEAVVAGIAAIKDATQSLGRSRLAPYMTAAGLAVQMTAKGGVILTPSDLASYQALGASLPGALWISAQYNDGNTVVNYHLSGFVIGKTPYETFFCVPAHGVGYQFQSITSAGYGANYNSPDGILANISLAYAGAFNPSAPNGNAGDIRVYRSTTVVPDSMVPRLAEAGSLGSGDLVTSGGHGIVSSPSTGIITGGGATLTGWNATVLNGVPLSMDGSSHRSTFFSTSSGVYLNGAPNPGDSGAPLYENGQLVGMIVGGLGSYTDTIRTGQFADFTLLGGYREQILPYSGISTVPEPASSARTVAIGLAALAAMRRWMLKNK
jgi:hypothetical protein